MRTRQKQSVLMKLFLSRATVILFMISFFSALTLGPKMLNIDGDLPRHLLMGKFVVENSRVPTHELFSYVYENRPYVSHEWLAGLIYFLLYRLFGLNGVVLLASILIASTFTVIHFWSTANNNGNVLNFLLIFMGAIATSIHWITRPHLFTMLFLALWLILMDGLYRGTPIKLWMFPAIMLLWANMHAEFIAGFLVLIACIVGWGLQYLFNRPNIDFQLGKHLSLVTGLSLIVSAIHPAGFRTWEIVLNYINNRYLLSRIAETQPPNFAHPEYWPLLLTLGLSIFLLVIKKDKFVLWQFFLIIGFGVMSLISARNAHLFGVVAPFVLLSAAHRTTSSEDSDTKKAANTQTESHKGRTILPIALTILIGLILLTGPLGSANRFEPSIFPVEAVRWLENNPQSGRMFNAFDWGGYILFHLWPEQKVFIESQTDVTGEVTQKYETIITLRDGWKEIFQEYDITWAIIPPQWPLAQELIGQGWQSLYQDQTAIILAKK